MKVLLIQKLKLKSQKIGVLHKNFEKKSPPTLLGRWGTFEKEINELITLGRNE
jgi:hypothetical protein